MKITLAELRLRINDLKNEYSECLQELQRGATKTTIIELSGHSEKLSAEYDFNEGLAKVNSISNKLSRLNAVVSKANASTSISETDTIQTAINKLQEKRKLLNTVESILATSRERKSRKSDGGYSGGTAFYEHINLNFIKEDLVKFRDELKSELNNLEVKVQEVNNITEVEI